MTPEEVEAEILKRRAQSVANVEEATLEITKKCWTASIQIDHVLDMITIVNSAISGFNESSDIVEPIPLVSFDILREILFKSNLDICQIPDRQFRH